MNNLSRKPVGFDLCRHCYPGVVYDCLYFAGNIIGMNLKSSSHLQWTEFLMQLLFIYLFILARLCNCYLVGWQMTFG